MRSTQGEEDPLLNTIFARNAIDTNGQNIGDQLVALPENGSIDYNTYDWLFSFKEFEFSDVDHEFNDLIMSRFKARAATGGIPFYAVEGRQGSSVSQADG
jgi:hypothetical protein